MNETKGTGIFVEDGIYFQPYGSNSSNFPWGDSLAIQATGAMGALQLHKKLSDKEDPLVIARERRNSIELNELVKNNEAAYFEWSHIANVKKSWFTKTVTINMNDGSILTLRGQDNKTAFEFVSEKTEKND